LVFSMESDLNTLEVSNFICLTFVPRQPLLGHDKQPCSTHTLETFWHSAVFDWIHDHTNPI
jgi:hypothetical protein